MLIDEEKPILGYDKELSKLFTFFKSDLDKGLTSEEAIRLQNEKYGLNIIPKPKQSLYQLYLAPIFNILINVYLIMTAILCLLAFFDSSLWTQSLQWLILIALNAVIAIVQQYRAQAKLDALHKLSAPEARVIRNGSTMKISSEKLVPGDLIELSQGDRIPADIRIISSNNFMVNEASLTGESVAAIKTTDGKMPLDKETAIGERNNMAYMGCFVQTGNAKGVVINTGGKTEIGKLSIELDELNTGDIPLRRKINKLAKYLVMGSLFLLFTTLTFRLLTRKSSASVVLIIADSIVTAMSIMPINIPLLTTVVLLTGVLAMANHRVIVRDLSGIESLGRCSVLCSDKTGTITRSQMTVKRIWDGISDKLYGVTGLGYGVSGQIYQTNKDPLDTEDEKFVPDSLNIITPKSTLELMLISGMLNNSAELVVNEVFEPDGRTSWKAVGSPTDAALLAVFEKAQLNKTDILLQYKLLKEYSFDSAYKRMSRIFDNGNSEKIMFTKGALEVLLPKCSKIGLPENEEKLLDKKRKEILEYSNDFAKLGYRIITMTFKKINNLPEDNFKNLKEEREKIENDLTYLGFFCLLDPPREGVRKSVKEATKAGITTIMITGDSPITAATIAQKTGILDETGIVKEGSEIENLGNDDFDNTKVFSRVSPQHKQIIIERYKEQKKVVAMTGDGVNDSLALSMADAGVAMGITGTDVAKQAADIVIADDSFNSIVTGVRLGRSLFEKIRVMILFYILVNLAEGSVYFLTSFIPNFYLFSSWQRIYVFSTIHAFPPLALIFDSIPSDIMRKEPRNNSEIFSKNLLILLFLTSISLAIMALFIYFIVPYVLLKPYSFNFLGIDPLIGTTDMSAIDWNQAKARTMLHTMYFFAESILVLSIRRVDKSLIRSIKEDSNILIYIMAFFIPLVHILLMYIPALQEIVGILNIDLMIIMLGPMDLLFCILIALVPILVLESVKHYFRSKGEFF